MGEEFSWTLPKVLNAHEDDYKIIVEPDLTLQPFLSFDEYTETIFFNGDQSSKQLVGLHLKIRYTIVDSLGNKYE